MIAASNGTPGSRAKLPPPLTDAEIELAVSWLRKYPSGLTRADLERIFGSDRRGRDVVVGVAERGIAAVINVRSDVHGGAKVYRLARTLAEVEEEERRLLAYEESVRLRRLGVRRAFERGPDPSPPQAPLFAKETP